LSVEKLKDVETAVEKSFVSFFIGQIFQLEVV